MTDYEPLLFRPRVFYSLAGAGLVAGILGLTPWAHYPNPIWWVGLVLAMSCFLGAAVAWGWSVPVRIEANKEE